MNRRDRHEDTTRDPAVEAELAALEAVLAGEPPTGELEEELAGLVREVRAEAPSMPLALRERLDRSVSEGFLGNRGGLRRSGRLARWLTPRRALPVLGVLAVVLVGLFVARGAIVDRAGTRENIAMSRVGPSMTEDTAVAPSSSADAQKELAPGAATTEPAPSILHSDSSPAAGTAAPSAKPVGPNAGALQASSARKVERAVDLSLRVGPGKLQDTSDGVVRVTQGVGGYVQDSQVSAHGSTGAADFTLRVPTAKLDEAIAKLSKLGHVSSLDQSSKDITASFTSVGEKLSDARAEHRALVRALSKAQTSGEIAALRERIRTNRAELASLKGQLNRLRGRADQATILVTVESRRGAVAPGTSGGGWTPGDAARDALRVLEVAAGVVIVAAAALVPLGLVVLLAVLFGRATRRRRREHALDGA